MAGASGRGREAAAAPNWRVPVTPPNGVARAQIFDGGCTQADIARYRGRVDFTWGARYLDWQPSDVLASRYVQPEILYSHTPPTSWKDYDLAWFRANHPDWVMYKNDRVTPAYGSGTWVPLDLSNPDVREWHFDLVVQPHIDNGAPVIAMDGMMPWNYTSRAGHHGADGTWVQQYTGAKFDADYVADKADYARWITGKLHAVGVAAAGNIFMQRDADTYEYQTSLQMAGELDIVVDEGGFLHRGLSHGMNGLADQSWRNHLGYVQTMLAAGKAVAVVDETSVIRGLDAPASEVAYSLASYFLYKSPGAMLYLGYYYGPFDERPEMDADIGVAVDQAHEVAGGAWVRHYTDGLSVVNPQSAPRRVNVPLPPGQYRDLSGTVVSRCVKLGPVSGTVLTRL